MIDVKTPNSPGWWLMRCHRKLQDRLPRLTKLAAYRDGDPPLPRRSEVEKEAFRAFLKTSRLNMAESLVSSITERLAVRAIRTARYCEPAIPACCTTFPQRAISALMNCCNSATDGSFIGTMPVLAICSLISGRPSTAFTAALA